MKILFYFDNLQEIHLNKDVGAICIHLTKLPNVEECILATNKNNTSNKDIIELSEYNLLQSVNRFNVIIFYHFTLKSLMRGLLIRITNKHVKLVLKTDVDRRYIKSLELSKRKIIFRMFQKIYNLFLVETKQHTEELQKIAKQKHKFVTILNGSKIKRNRTEDNTERKNEILIIGRLGLTQKNVPFLLRILSETEKIQELDCISLVGKMDGPNSLEIKRLLYKLQKKYTLRLMGNINNHKKLVNEFSRAKVMLVPSLYESFGLVIAEAAVQRTPIVAHDVGIMQDLAAVTNLVKIVGFNDKNDWIKNIKYFLNYNIVDTCISTQVDEMFCWDKICKNLYKEIKKC